MEDYKIKTVELRGEYVLPFAQSVRFQRDMAEWEKRNPMQMPGLYGVPSPSDRLGHTLPHILREMGFTFRDFLGGGETVRASVSIRGRESARRMLLDILKLTLIAKENGFRDIIEASPAMWSALARAIALWDRNSWGLMIEACESLDRTCREAMRYPSWQDLASSDCQRAMFPEQMIARIARLHGAALRIQKREGRYE